MSILASLATEFDFVLPRGLVDASGQLHRQGVMRLATARDELLVQRDRRVRQNDAYAPILMLSQVITQLGELPSITPDCLEGLFSQDLAYLRELFNRVNQQGSTQITTACPHCNSEFSLELELAGESQATP